MRTFLAAVSLVALVSPVAAGATGSEHDTSCVRWRCLSTRRWRKVPLG